MGSAVNGGESYDVTFATCSSEQLWEPNADDVSGACATTRPAKGAERGAPDADPLPRFIKDRAKCQPAPPSIWPEMIRRAPRVEPP